MFNKNSNLDPIPFYILTFNRVKGLESALEFSKRSTTELNIVIVDMGSTWPPFLELIDSGRFNVVRFPKGTHPRDLLPNRAWRRALYLQRLHTCIAQKQ